MRTLLFSLYCTVWALLPLPALAASNTYGLHNVQDGDIIFQPSQSFQSKAIEIATGSPYTHCGIVLMHEGKPYVFEAIRTVQSTPLEQWVKRGTGGKYVLMRLDAGLSKAHITALRREAKTLDGKSYDLLFNWSDEAIYCSELVWKLFDRALDVQLVPLRTLRDYSLDHTEVQRQIKERFNYDIPWDEPVIAPSDLMESPRLKEIASLQ